jgi:hypothetical protein
MAKGKSSNIFVWILMGLLIVGLAGFGATNFGGTITSVGRVGDTEIEVNTYARALEQELRAIGAGSGTATPAPRSCSRRFAACSMRLLISPPPPRRHDR